MKPAIETHDDGSKTYRVFPLLLWMVVANAGLVVAVWLCVAMWRWAL